MIVAFRDNDRNFTLVIRQNASPMSVFFTRRRRPRKTSKEKRSANTEGLATYSAVGTSPASKSRACPFTCYETFLLSWMFLGTSLCKCSTRERCHLTANTPRLQDCHRHSMLTPSFFKIENLIPCSPKKQIVTALCTSISV